MENTRKIQQRINLLHKVSLRNTTIHPDFIYIKEGLFEIEDNSLIEYIDNRIFTLEGFWEDQNSIYNLITEINKYNYLISDFYKSYSFGSGDTTRLIDYVQLKYNFKKALAQIEDRFTNTEDNTMPLHNYLSKTLFAKR